MNFIAYFTRETKWEDCVAFIRERGDTVHYRPMSGVEFGITAIIPAADFYTKYRIIFAEDFAEERERLLQRLQNSTTQQAVGAAKVLAEKPIPCPKCGYFKRCGTCDDTCPLPSPRTE